MGLQELLSDDSSFAKVDGWILLCGLGPEQPPAEWQRWKKFDNVFAVFGPPRSGKSFFLKNYIAMLAADRERTKQGSQSPALESVSQALMSLYASHPPTGKTSTRPISPALTRKLAERKEQYRFALPWGAIWSEATESGAGIQELNDALDELSKSIGVVCDSLRETRKSFDAGSVVDESSRGES